MGGGLRKLIVLLMALSGLAVGALFTLPTQHREFVSVRINGASLIAEVAADYRARSRRLSGSGAFARGSATLFAFDKAARYAVRMKGTEFPADIFWIRNGMVADLEEGVLAASASIDGSSRVWRPDVPAEMILQTRAGFAGEGRVRIGDRVFIGSAGSALAAVSAALPSALAEPAPAGREYFIETIRAKPPHGRNFKIRRVLETNAVYQKFLVSYESDGVALTGVMNIPFGPVPDAGFPVLILNHGLIRPSIYYSGRGSRREQDFFAREGYATIHPDYRGYSGTKENFPSRHDFYVGYTRDVLGLIDVLKRQDQRMLDLGRLGMWGHSMGGGIAARVAVLSPDVRAYVLFAPISADVEDNFYELAAKEVKWLRETYGPAGAEVYRRMSPLEYFSEVRSPIQLHHGIADRDVPISFSRNMFAALTGQGKRAELFTYPGEGHEFAGAWTLAAGRALQFFDRYLKK